MSNFYFNVECHLRAVTLEPEVGQDFLNGARGAKFPEAPSVAQPNVVMLPRETGAPPLALTEHGRRSLS